VIERLVPPDEVVFRVEDGFPIPDVAVNPQFESSTSVAYFDKETRLMIRGTSMDTITNATKIEGRVWSVRLNDRKLFHFGIPVKVGDYITLHPR